MRPLIENLERREYLSALPSCMPGPVILPPQYDGHTAIVAGVVNIWAADPVDFGATWSAEPTDPVAALFGSDGIPNMDAVFQGQTPNCYLLAAVAGRQKMTDLIWWDGFGWAEKWYGFDGTPAIIHTQNTFSVALQARTGEVYWEVSEKTYAYFRTWDGQRGSQNSMASTGWGFTTAVWKQTGEPGTIFYVQSFMPAQEIEEKIHTAEAAGKPVVIATNFDAPDMVRSHVYVLAAFYADDTALVYNPWGFYETRTLSDLLLNGTIELMVA